MMTHVITKTLEIFDVASARVISTTEYSNQLIFRFKSCQPFYYKNLLSEKPPKLSVLRWLNTIHYVTKSN